MLPGLVLAALAGAPLVLGAAGGVLVAAGAIALAGRDERLGGDTGVAVAVSAPVRARRAARALARRAAAPAGAAVRRPARRDGARTSPPRRCSPPGSPPRSRLAHRRLSLSAFDRAAARSLGAEPGALGARAARAAGGRHRGRGARARQPAARRADRGAGRRRAAAGAAAAGGAGRWRPRSARWPGSPGCCSRSTWGSRRAPRWRCARSRAVALSFAAPAPIGRSRTDGETSSSILPAALEGADDEMLRVLATLAYQDALTGLANRRALEERLERRSPTRWSAGESCRCCSATSTRSRSSTTPTATRPATARWCASPTALTRRRRRARRRLHRPDRRRRVLRAARGREAPAPRASWRWRPSSSWPRTRPLQRVLRRRRAPGRRASAPPTSSARPTPPSTWPSAPAAAACTSPSRGAMSRGAAPPRRCATPTGAGASPPHVLVDARRRARRRARPADRIEAVAVAFADAFDASGWAISLLPPGDRHRRAPSYEGGRRAQRVSGVPSLRFIGTNDAYARRRVPGHRGDHGARRRLLRSAPTTRPATRPSRRCCAHAGHARAPSPRPACTRAPAGCSSSTGTRAPDPIEGAKARAAAADRGGPARRRMSVIGPPRLTGHVASATIAA